MAREKATPIQTPPVKKPKLEPGAYAPRKQSDYVRSNLCIDKRAFQRIVQEISIKVGHEKDMDIRYTELALMATQEATEAFISELLVEASYIASIRKRKDNKINMSDLAVARRMLLKEL